jgi:hypothetical protein
MYTKSSFEYFVKFLIKKIKITAAITTRINPIVIGGINSKIIFVDTNEIPQKITVKNINKMPKDLSFIIPPDNNG